MNVLDLCQVSLWATRSRFEFQKTPYFTLTDYPWQTGTNNQQNATMPFSADLQCFYSSPIFVPHNNGPENYYGEGGVQLNLPSISWTPIDGSNPPAFQRNNPFGFAEMYLDGGAAQPGTERNEEFLALAWQGTCQGFTFIYKRTEKDDSVDGGSPYQKFTTFQIGVGTGSDTILYSLEFQAQGDARLYKGIYDGTGGYNWTMVGTTGTGSDIWGTNMGKAASNFYSGSYGVSDDGRYSYICFMLIAGRLVVYNQSKDQAYFCDEWRVDENGNPIWQINYAVMKFYDYQRIECSGHPMKFSISDSMSSPELSIGFYNPNVNPIYVDSAGIVPPGVDVTLDPNGETYLAGPIIDYSLLLTSQQTGTYKEVPYADWAGAVRSINISWVGETDFNPASPVFPEPHDVLVEHFFDPDSLTVDSSAKLRFNSTLYENLPTGEFGTWAQWGQNYGHVAIEVQMTRNSPDGGTLPFGTIFTGYGNTTGTSEGHAGQVIFTMSGKDRKIQLDNPRWDLPWMDGWNVFYAIAYLAQLGGVSIDDMGFSALIPPVAFGPGSDLGDGNGNGAYYLPVGSAGAQLTRFSGTSLWDTMKKISNSIGYMMFFDVYGVLQFSKFSIPNGIKRFFFESDPESAAQSGGGLEGCWSIQTIKDMSEVRSDMILIGVDAFTPQWNPIVERWTDDGVINNVSAFNHLGYKNPSVWIDSQFADPDFASEAAAAMYRYFRTPGLNLSLTTWSQPDLFPLDVISLQSDRFGVSAIPMVILGVRHSQTIDIGSTTIFARFVPQ